MKWIRARLYSFPSGSYALGSGLSRGRSARHPANTGPPFRFVLSPGEVFVRVVILGRHPPYCSRFFHVCMPQMLERYTATGIKYYYNPRTKKAQWTPPTAQGSGPGSDAAGGRPGGLPPGWEKRKAPDGRDYFVNHNTK